MFQWVNTFIAVAAAVATILAFCHLCWKEYTFRQADKPDGIWLPHRYQQWRARKRKTSTIDNLYFLMAALHFVFVGILGLLQSSPQPVSETRTVVIVVVTSIFCIAGWLLAASGKAILLRRYGLIYNSRLYSWFYKLRTYFLCFYLLAFAVFSAAIAEPIDRPSRTHEEATPPVQAQDQKD